MVRASAAEVNRKFGQYRETALVEPVIIQNHARDSVVMISATEYARLLKLDRKVQAIEELSDAEFEAIAQSKMSAEHERLNALLED